MNTKQRFERLKKKKQFISLFEFRIFLKNSFTGKITLKVLKFRNKKFILFHFYHKICSILNLVENKIVFIKFECA